MSATNRESAAPSSAPSENDSPKVYPTSVLGWARRLNVATSFLWRRLGAIGLARHGRGVPHDLDEATVQRALATRAPRPRPKCAACPNEAAAGHRLCDRCFHARVMAARARKAARRAAGLCANCGKSPACEGQRLCGACNAARRAQQRANYAKAKAAGLCGSCHTRPALAPRVLCANCGRRDRVREREATRTTRKARRAAGLCVLCGLTPSPAGKLCPDCRAVRRAKERERLAAKALRGECLKCARPRAFGQLCARCHPKYLTARPKRVLHCSECREAGHNARTCPNARRQAA